MLKEEGHLEHGRGLGSLSSMREAECLVGDFQVGPLERVGVGQGWG